MSVLTQDIATITAKYLDGGDIYRLLSASKDIHEYINDIVQKVNYLKNADIEVLKKDFHKLPPIFGRYLLKERGIIDDELVSSLVEYSKELSKEELESFAYVFNTFIYKKRIFYSYYILRQNPTLFETKIFKEFYVSAFINCMFRISEYSERRYEWPIDPRHFYGYDSMESSIWNYEKKYPQFLLDCMIFAYDKIFNEENIHDKSILFICGDCRMESNPSAEILYSVYSKFHKAGYKFYSNGLENYLYTDDSYERKKIIDWEIDNLP